MFMKTILVATDFSAEANNAMAYAAALAKLFKARILLFNAYPVVMLATEVPIEYPDDNAAKEHALYRLNRKAKQLSKEFSIQVQVDAEPAGEEAGSIVNAITRNKADLVVMGSRGATTFGERVFGSTTSYVINHSPVPIIIVPKSFKYKPVVKMIVACENIDAFTQPIVHALQFLPEAFSARLVLFWLLDIDDYTGSRKAIKDIAQQVAAGPEVPQVTAELAGINIENGIDEFAVQEGAGLIVMLPQKHDFFSRLFRGSVTKKLAVHTHVPLLILPHLISEEAVRQAFEKQAKQEAVS
jgi:nucleotide-binding universal stress UspA family protein